MAKYYFCNGTTKKDLPCQNPVRKEKDRCAYHGGGGGPGPSIFSLLKSGVDAVVWLHAANDAVPFVFDVAKRVIEIFSFNFNISVGDIEEINYYLEQNEAEFIRRINSMDEINLKEIVAICNLAIALMENKGHFKEEELLVHA